MDSKELAGVVSAVRAGGAVALPVRTRDWYAELEVLAPASIEPSGAVITPRQVRVALRVAVRGEDRGAVLAEHRRDVKIFQQSLNWDFGKGQCFATSAGFAARSGFAAARVIDGVFAADTLSAAVALAVAEWEQIDADAYRHIVARDAAIAAEEAAYAVRLAS